MSKVYTPVGNTSSGKTTRCKQWAENNQPAVLIEADALRTLFFGKYIYDSKLEPTIRLILESCVGHWLAIGYNVAVDDAVFYLTRQQREEFVYESIVPEQEQVIWDFLPIPTDDEVRERRKNEDRGIDLEEWVRIKNEQAAMLELED